MNGIVHSFLFGRIVGFVVCGAFERELWDQQIFFQSHQTHYACIVLRARTYTELAANRYCPQGQHVEAMISIRQSYAIYSAVCTHTRCDIGFENNNDLAYL